jgi:hypothetical protein
MVINVKVKSRAWVDDIKMLINVKYSRELSARLKASTAMVSNPNVI